jgi:O-antigen biosynthesis protein
MANIEGEIFVIDNNSSDGSRDYLTPRFPNVHFIWNKENSGFAKANNIALKETKGDYILFLNPDTIVSENCFEKCIAFLKEHNDDGALGIRMIDGSGIFLKESKRAFPSPLTSFYKLSGLTRVFPKSGIFGRYYLGHVEEHKDHEVDVLAGAFILTPRKIIDEAGSFDEAFFMYGEDVDLSYRIQKAGYKNYYLGSNTIIHFKGESTRKGSLNYIRMFYNAMSIFVKKHYGGTRVRLFNVFIQVAILIRAAISAVIRFIRWVGMPVIDAAIILMSFSIVKILWNTYVRKEVNYSPNMLKIAFPVFTLIFLAASFYSGLYDNGYKQSRLNKATLSSILILLAGYSLLPEELRFSRGILVFGSLAAFIFMSIIRNILVKARVIESAEEEDENRQTIIVGTVDEYNEVTNLMDKAGMNERILGRMEVKPGLTVNTIGNIDGLQQILNMYSIKEIILCAGHLSFKKVIDITEATPHRVRIKLHGSGTNSIVGSTSKNVSGEFVAEETSVKLSTPVGKRNKGLADFLMTMGFIVTLPVHIIAQKKRAGFIRNLWRVSTGNASWVGYANSGVSLPPLKEGVISTTGVPKHLNILPEESLRKEDLWYVKDYSLWEDMKLVWKGYRYLGE